MSRRIAALAATLALCASISLAQSYDSYGRLLTSTRLQDGSGFIVPVLDTTLTLRFPVGTTPADNESNAVSITRSGAFVFVYDGATWDRWTGAVTQSGTWNVGTVTTITNPVAVTGTFWPTAAASPLSSRLSDGSAFYDAAKTGQLPPALESGRLAVGARITTSSGGYEAFVTNTNELMTEARPRSLQSFLTFDSAGDEVSVSSNDTIGATFGFVLEPGTLAATIVPECTGYALANTKTGYFLDATGALSQSVVVTNPNPAVFKEIICPGSTVTARARVSSYTSGSADAVANAFPSPSHFSFANLRDSSGAEIGTATTPIFARPHDGTLGATVRDTGASDSLNVAIVDAAGNHVTSFGGGTQYAEGATAATITGTAAMWEDTGDTLRAISAAKPLPVNVVAGGAGDGAIQDGTTPSIEATVLDFTNSNPLAVRLTDTNGDYVGAGAGTQYADGAAQATPTGTVALGHDGANVRAITTDASGDLQVDILSGTVTANAGTGNFNVVGTTTSAPALSAAALNVRSVESQRTATGTLGALDAAVTIAGEGSSAIVVEVDSGLVGSVTFEATQDGSNWFATYVLSLTTGSRVTTITNSLLPYRASYGYTGFAQYRARVSAYTSGSSAARMGASAAVGGVLLTGGTLDNIVSVVSTAGTKSNNNVVPGATNLSVLAAIANAAAPTYTEGNAVMPRTQLDGDLVTVMEDELPAGTQNIGDVDVVTMPAITGTVTANAGTGTFAVAGGKSDNGGAPGATNLGTLPAVALAADPTRTEGNQVALRAQLDGDLVVAMVDEIPAGTQNIGDVDIVTFPDNEPFNLAQVAGSATATGNGTAAGSIRVSVASDSTGQIAVASLPNEGQQTAANSISITQDTDNDAIGATGAAPPGEVVDVGGRTSGADTTGLMTGLTICTDHAAIDIVTATTTLIVTGVANRHVRICSINLVTAAANNVALVAGTGATCATSTAGINGGVTAAEGWNFAANGGLTLGSGIGEVMSTKVSGGATGDSVCVITSAATQLSGSIAYAIY